MVEKQIVLKARQVLNLLNKEDIVVEAHEVYYDLDAEQYLHNGKSERVKILVGE